MVGGFLKPEEHNISDVKQPCERGWKSKQKCITHREPVVGAFPLKLDGSVGWSRFSRDGTLRLGRIKWLYCGGFGDYTHLAESIPEGPPLMFMVGSGLPL